MIRDLRQAKNTMLEKRFGEFYLRDLSPKQGTLSPQYQEIYDAWITLNTLLSEAGLPTDPRKMKEVIASILTGCVPNNEKSGPDCFFEENNQDEDAERKSTTSKNIKGSYTGLSNQKTWPAQVEYTKKKIKNMKRHYYDRFCARTGRLLESWYLTGDIAYDILIKKIEKDFHNSNQRKDPRLKASVSMTEIKQHGTQVF